MPKRRKPRPRRLVRTLTSRSRRVTLQSALRLWHRNRVVRIGAGIVLAWLIGTIGIFLAEHRTNDSFKTLGESFWSAWVLLFSGLEIQPSTAFGRLFAMILVVSGLGLVGLFTGTVASILVEYQLRRREVSHFEMEDHLVLCNWAPRGLQWIREVHGKIIQDKRPVVIIHDNPEGIVLPDKQEDVAFNDVYIVRGDPTNEVILRRARVAQAHSVVVLSDDRQGEHSDGKTILTCIAIRNVCRGDHQPNIAVECRQPQLQPSPA